MPLACSRRLPDASVLLRPAPIVRNCTPAKCWKQSRQALVLMLRIRFAARHAPPPFPASLPRRAPWAISSQLACVLRRCQLLKCLAICYPA